MLGRLLLALAACLSTASALQLPPAPRAPTRRAILRALPLVAIPLAATADDEVLHVIDYPEKGKCGEALVPEKGVPFVKMFGGFGEGSCKDAGYPDKIGEAKGTGDKDEDRTYEIYAKD